MRGRGRENENFGEMACGPTTSIFLLFFPDASYAHYGPINSTPTHRSTPTRTRHTHLLQLEPAAVKCGASEHHRLDEAGVLAAELAEGGRALAEVELGDLLEHLGLLVGRSHRRHETLRL